MAGTRMEVFRFGVYLFFPIAIMVYFGDPGFYDRHVRQALKDLYPPPEKCNSVLFNYDYRGPQKIPSTQSEIQAQLAELKAAHAARKARENAKADGPVPSTGGSETK
ncbi:hypothetical protein IWQ60_001295 [Tieghemiomyces parasiticus]|uniref:Mitochondrial cytochrome c oxidase assembly factor n=1 Tax=Tieghemiomyces parasiticus TaxID=78921 RepID=A0A9W8AKW5_9FUNG|nr:hypothetical protein IWQ60_001295 [Tieghemiomyces parasiticus]